MRVCSACGRENPDDADFCVCGEYLRWEPTGQVRAVPGPASGQVAVADRKEAAEASGPPEPVLDVDPSVTLAPAAVPQTPAAVRHAPVTSAGDGRGAAALTLRPVDREGAPGEPVAVEVEPGSRATILGLIRNQSDVVDNFDLSRARPARRLVDGDAGDRLSRSLRHERNLRAGDRDPSPPAARSRGARAAVAFEVVAVSRAHGGEAASAPASVAIQPYFDIAAELRPERRSGRLKARYTLTVRNRANARTEVAVAAEDEDGECEFRFAQPSVAIEPGNAIECPFTCLPPRQVWLGRTVERRFQVLANPVGVVSSVPPPPRAGVFRQRAWLPWWLAIVAPIAVVAAVALISLLPKQAKVPNLKGAANVFAAQKLVNSAGFQLSPRTTSVLDATKQPGAIADQSPRAGTKAKRGSIITVAVYTGTGKVDVPSVLGATPGLADQALRASQLTLGAVSPQPLDPEGKIRSQIPLAGTKVAAGTAVAVFMAPAGGARRPRAPGRAPGARPRLPLPRVPRPRPRSPPSPPRRARARLRFRS